MEKIKLYFPEEKEINLRKIVTPRLRGELAEVFSKFKEADNSKLITRAIEILQKVDSEVTTDNVMDKFREAISKKLITDSEVNEIINLSKELTRIDPELIKKNDNLKFQIMKIIIDITGLSEKETEQVNTDDFWNEQDLEGMDEAINFFRQKAKL